MTTTNTFSTVRELLGKSPVTTLRAPVFSNGSPRPFDQPSTSISSPSPVDQSGPFPSFLKAALQPRMSPLDISIQSSTTSLKDEDLPKNSPSDNQSNESTSMNQDCKKGKRLDSLVSNLHRRKQKNPTSTLGTKRKLENDHQMGDTHDQSIQSTHSDRLRAISSNGTRPMGPSLADLLPRTSDSPCVSAPPFLSKGPRLGPTHEKLRKLLAPSNTQSSSATPPIISQPSPNTVLLRTEATARMRDFNGQSPKMDSRRDSPVSTHNFPTHRKSLDQDNSRDCRISTMPAREEVKPDSASPKGSRSGEPKRGRELTTPKLSRHNDAAYYPNIQCILCSEWVCSRNRYMHIESHLQYRPYKCSLCGYDNRKEIFINLHIKRTHKGSGKVVYQPDPDLEHRAWQVAEQCLQHTRQVLIKQAEGKSEETSGDSEATNEASEGGDERSGAVPSSAVVDPSVLEPYKDVYRPKIYNTQRAEKSQLIEESRQLGLVPDFTEVASREENCGLCASHIVRHHASLEEHVRTHLKQPSYRCDINGCLVEHESKNFISRHMKEVHKYRRQPLDILEIHPDLVKDYLLLCQRAFPTFFDEDAIRRIGYRYVGSALHARHFKKPDSGSCDRGQGSDVKFVGDPGRECQLCSQMVSGMDYKPLLEHAKTHLSKTPFICVLCGSTDQNETNLRHHIQIAHPQSEPNDVIQKAVTVQHSKELEILMDLCFPIHRSLPSENSWPDFSSSPTIKSPSVSGEKISTGPGNLIQQQRDSSNSSNRGFNEAAITIDDDDDEEVTSSVNRPDEAIEGPLSQVTSTSQLLEFLSTNKLLTSAAASLLNNQNSAEAENYIESTAKTEIKNGSGPGTDERLWSEIEQCQLCHCDVRRSQKMEHVTLHTQLPVLKCHFCWYRHCDPKLMKCHTQQMHQSDLYSRIPLHKDAPALLWQQILSECFPPRTPSPDQATISSSSNSTE